MLNIKKINSLTQTDIYWYRVTDSTNTVAKRKIFQHASLPFVVLAGKQTAGRGRMGRSFYSRGSGIYMSFAFKATSLCSAVSVTTAAAVAVTKALCECCESDFQIKWVNDVYQNGKKVCGILTEAVSGVGNESFVVVGIGINIGKTRFPKELQDIAGWVNLTSTREELVAKITNLLNEFAKDTQDRSYMDFYREHFMLLGAHVTAISDGESIRGRVVGVDDDGGLLLLREGDTAPTRIFSGEVTLRQINA